MKWDKEIRNLTTDRWQTSRDGGKEIPKTEVWRYIILDQSSSEVPGSITEDEIDRIRNWEIVRIEGKCGDTLVTDYRFMDYRFIVSLSCIWLFCDPMTCSPPGSSVHGVLQATIVEWIAISFPRGSSRPRDQIHVFCTGGQILTTEPPGKPRLQISNK